MSKSFDEFHEESQQKQDEWGKKRKIRELIELCSKSLGKGQRQNYYHVAVRLIDLHNLLVRDGEHSLAYYDRVLGDEDDWDWLAISRYTDNPSKYLNQLGAPPVDSVTSARHQINGKLDGDSTAIMTVRRAFESYVSIAEHEGVIDDELVNKVDAVIFDTKIGNHLQGYEQDFGDGPTKAYSFQKTALKSLFVGGTGSGKSTGAETEGWAFYSKNFTPGKDYKLIDLTYSENGENWTYDLPQQQKDLRRIREEMGEHPAFDSDPDAPDPKIEILVPLTPGLEDEELPYNTETEEFIVKPYTAPASEISENLLIGLVENLLTHQQESTLRASYQDVSKQDDWTLQDLKNDVKEQEDLDGGVKEQTARAIDRLIHAGFIRDKDDDHCLDWDEILSDNETITVFSISHVQDELARIMALAHALVSLREFKTGQDHLYPDTVLMIRELFELTPHQKRESDDALAAQLQKKMGSQMGKLMRRARHDGYHIIADTQKMGDLTKSVRELFNRYVVFDETKDTIKNIFSYTSNESYQSFYRTITTKTGEAGIVGEVEPAVNRKGIEFISPIQYCPPPFHHYDDDGPPGWIVRSHINEHEELRRPKDVEDVYWDSEPPMKPDENTSSGGEKQYDPKIKPMYAFVQQSIETGGEYTLKSDLQKAYNQMRREAGREPLDFSTRSAQTKFGKFKDACEAIHDYRPENIKREGGEYAYPSLRFNEKGRELFEVAQDRDVQDDGSPLE